MKGPYRQKKTQEQNKKEWASSVGLCQRTYTATSPPREGQPTGTLRAARDFSPRVHFQCRLSHGVRTPPCAIACIHICAHVKDPVVYVRVRRIMETPKHPACTVSSATLSQLAFPGGKSNPNFPWEKTHWDNTVVKNKNIDNNKNKNRDE